MATFIKIRMQTKELSSVLGNAPQRMKRLHNSARTMSLFVAVFFIQWISAACYSVTSLMGHIPDYLLYFIITFSNIGGVLNGIVFILNKRMRNMSSSKTTETTSSEETATKNAIHVNQIKMSIIPCAINEEHNKANGCLIDGIAYRKQA